MSEVAAGQGQREGGDDGELHAPLFAQPSLAILAHIRGELAPRIAESLSANMRLLGRVGVTEIRERFPEGDGAVIFFESRGARRPWAHRFYDRPIDYELQVYLGEGGRHQDYELPITRLMLPWFLGAIDATWPGCVTEGRALELAEISRAFGERLCR